MHSNDNGGEGNGDVANLEDNRLVLTNFSDTLAHVAINSTFLVTSAAKMY